MEYTRYRQKEEAKKKVNKAKITDNLPKYGE
jgi:hypothetical protein